MKYKNLLFLAKVFFLFSVLISFPTYSASFPLVYVAPGIPSGENVSVVDMDTGTITGTIHIGAGIRDLVVNSTGTRVYCAHSGDFFADPPDPGFVSVIDTTANTVIDTVSIGPKADDVAINPSGTRLYVSYHTDAAELTDQDMIAVIDTSTNEVTNTIAIGGDVADMVFSPNGAILYISNPELDSIIVLNASTFQVLANIPAPQAPLGLTLNPLGTRLYAANEDGPVSVINTSTRKTIASIICGDELDTMAISPDGTALYVPHYWRGVYRVVATATNRVTQTVSYSDIDYAGVRGVAVNQDGSRLFLGSVDYDAGTFEDTATPTLYVFETATHQLIDTVKFEERIGRIVLVESIMLDTDHDGLIDDIEDTVCTDRNDADTDDDGILDGVEDANHNGIVDAGETNPCDSDTDNDGIQDGTESGLTLDDVGPDTNLAVFIPDLDPGTTTDPLRADTDDDGISDGDEDLNQNGRVDEGESDPNPRPGAMPWIPALLLE